MHHTYNRKFTSDANDDGTGYCSEDGNTETSPPATYYSYEQHNDCCCQ